MKSLKDKVVVITGAGSGIGRASALEFAREGAAGVVAADLRAAAARETAALIEAEGGRAVWVEADVSRAEGPRAAVEAALAGFGGRLDVLFNNAGLPMAFTPIEEVSEAHWDRLFEVNVKGVYHGVQAALPYMRRQGGGVILNMASTAALRPRPGLSAYCATKAAVVGLTKALALELAPHRIRVVAICPVATDTPMLPQFIGVERGADEEEGRRRFIASIPWGRLNTPEDIARAAVYLASPAAEMVTGTAFEIDGGRDV
jgi:3-oxoacyl-[acyl-carrier protein] reductase